MLVYVYAPSLQSTRFGLTSRNLYQVVHIWISRNIFVCLCVILCVFFLIFIFFLGFTLYLFFTIFFTSALWYYRLTKSKYQLKAMSDCIDRTVTSSNHVTHFKIWIDLWYHTLIVQGVKKGYGFGSSPIIMFLMLDSSNVQELSLTLPDFVTCLCFDVRWLVSILHTLERKCLNSEKCTNCRQIKPSFCLLLYRLVWMV